MTSVTFLFNGLRDKITLEGGANKSLVSQKAGDVLNLLLTLNVVSVTLLYLKLAR